MAKQPQTEELSQAQIQAELDEFDIKLERLRVRYEQYFLGLERIPPSVLRTDVVRMMRRIEQYHLRNTAMKFRFRSLVQKFHSYSTYWNRTIREIESGTYRRHVDKARTKRDRRSERLGRAAEAAEGRSADDEARGREQVSQIAAEAEDFLAALGGGKPKQGAAAAKRSISVSFDDLDDEFDDGFGVRPDTGLNPTVDVFGGQSASRPTPPPRPTPPRPPPPPQRAAPPAPPSASRDGNQRLYDEFVAARERLGMGDKRVSYDKFASSLERQAAQVRRSHQCSDVEFRVVVKDGKPFLKPVPKK